MLYKELCEVYKDIGKSNKRLDKTFFLSKFFKKLKNVDEEEIKMVSLMLQGKVFPSWEESKMGFSSSLAVKAISVASGLSNDEVKDIWREEGDLGEVAERVIKKKKQMILFGEKELTVKKVFSNLQKLAALEGRGSVDMKIKHVAELLGNAKGSESKYIIKTVLDEMRMGVQEGVMRDAITWAFFPKIYPLFVRCRKCNEDIPYKKRCLNCAFDIPKGSKVKGREIVDIEHIEVIDMEKERFLIAKDEPSARKIYNYLVSLVQNAYDISNDFGEVIIKARRDPIRNLSSVKMEAGRPMKVMLALKEKDAESALKRVGRPTAAEYKLDGFRVQIHKKGEKIKIYTRRLENVTKQFPDIIDNVKKYCSDTDFIIDCEVVGFKKDKYLAFQNISQRIRRKYDIGRIAKEVPVEVDIFDILFFKGSSVIHSSFIERRKMLKDILPKNINGKIVLVKQIVTDDISKIKEFYDESLARGNEGLMLKALDAPYKPGARVGYMVKLKPVMETLDLVIVGAEWGEGKRANWLSSFVLACMDDGELKEIGKVGTGIKEKDSELTFKSLTDELKDDIIGEHGREVKIRPRVVLEVNYEEIQESSNYSSGYALRFPRVVRIREDKPVEEISDIQLVKRLYKEQRGGDR